MTEKIVVFRKGYRFKPIKTKRLLLIKPNLKYIDEYISILEDKRMWKYDSLGKPITKRNISTFFKKRIKDWKKQSGFFFLIIYNNKVIGAIGTNYINYFSQKTEINYDITYPLWNKGFGTEAISAYIDWIYSSTYINRIEAGFATPNIGSKKVLIKNGFVKEGLKRESAIYNNKTYDDYIYSILRKDWEKRKKKK